MSIKNAPGLYPGSKSFVRTALRGALSTVLFAAIPAFLLIACPTANAGNPAVWSLVWSDEFDGPNGSAVDSSKWSFDIGGDGWGEEQPRTPSERTCTHEPARAGLVFNRVL